MSYNIVQEDGTLKKVAGLSKLNVWTGTQSDYNAQKNTIPNGSYVNITDDAESGNGIKDIYSTDEVKTNKVWIDGKPIYRKVLTGLSFGNTLTTWTNVGATAILPNAETLITATVCRTYDNSIHTEIPIACANGQLKYYIYAGMQTSNNYNFDKIVCEYTKTS